jgi:hypothetical protein
VLAGDREDSVLDFDLDLVGRAPRKVGTDDGAPSRRITSIDGC